MVWNPDREWRSVPRVCGPWTVLPCCGNSALPIAVPSRFIAPSIRWSTCLLERFFAARRQCESRKRIARETRYLHHHESCQQNPSHHAKKNARIALQCAQYDMHAAVQTPATRLHRISKIDEGIRKLTRRDRWHWALFRPRVPRKRTDQPIIRALLNHMR